MCKARTEKQHGTAGAERFQQKAATRTKEETETLLAASWMRSRCQMKLRNLTRSDEVQLRRGRHTEFGRRRKHERGGLPDDAKFFSQNFSFRWIALMSSGLVPKGTVQGRVMTSSTNTPSHFDILHMCTCALATDRDHVVTTISSCG